MKHAFLIIAYKDYWMLNQIVKSLDDSRNDIYIHMDLKAQDFTEDVIVSTKHSEVFFVERLDVSWGGDSKIKCIILMLNYARNNGKYRYFHLMTESDYLIKNMDYLHDFFDLHDGQEFIDFREPLYYMSRFYDQYHFFQNALGRNDQYLELYPIEQNLLKIQVQNNFHRIDEGILYYRSEGVFSITSDFVNYVIDNIGFIAKNFFDGIYADEYFIATLIMNSDFQKNIYYKNIRLIDWDHRPSNVPHPITFTCSHYDSIINSDCIFARKFNSYVDYKIVSLINDKVHGSSSDETINAFFTIHDVYAAISNSDYTVCIPQFIVGKTILEGLLKTDAHNYFYIARDLNNCIEEKVVNDQCVAVLYEGGHQCSSIRIGNKYYSMEPREGYHLFFICNGVVDGCIIDVNERKICNPLIKKIENKSEIPALNDIDLQMLRSKSSWQRYRSIRMLLSRPYINISFDNVFADLLEEDSPYSYVALASLQRDKRFHYYDLIKACDCLKKAITSNEIWITEQWTLELFDLLQLIGTNESYQEAIRVLSPLLGSDNSSAIGYLAKCYRYGHGVEKDLCRAADLMKKAADQNVGWAKVHYFDILWDIDTPESLEEMIEYALMESNLGNMGLRARLARAYRDGKGVEKDFNKSVQLMKEAADNRVDWAKWEYFNLLWTIGTPESLGEMIEYAQIESDYGNMELRARLARAYRDGKGVEKDLRKAANLMRDVHGEKPYWAKQEYFDILWSMKTPETDTEMFQFIESLSKDSNKEYLIRLARCYRDGRGVERNLETAARLMKEAGELGQEKARWEYIDILWSMKTPETDRQIIDYITTLDELDNRQYQYRLARMYRDGRGVVKDLNKAAELMRCAAYQDLARAKWEYYEILWKIDTPESCQLMIEYGQKESDFGNMELRARLARAYRDGKGVEKDLRKAVNLIRTVLPGKPVWARWEYLDILRMINTAEADAEAFDYVNTVIDTGNKEYEARLARMYRDGRGTEKDTDKAVHYMRLASDQNLVWAKIELFDIMWEMVDDELDKEAFGLVCDLAEKGNGKAMGRLARCYRDGRGTNVNLDLAELWMQNAANKKNKWANDELKQIQEMKLRVNCPNPSLFFVNYLKSILKR